MIYFETNVPKERKICYKISNVFFSSRSRQGFGPLYSPAIEVDESESKGEFPLGKFCECLAQDLFHSAWEVRHGAATALREIIKLQGHSFFSFFLFYNFTF